MSIQWIKGSTHKDPDSNCFYAMYRDVWHQVFEDGSTCKSSSLYNGEINASDLIERHQPKPWSGPEDGLPPVGTMCEMKFDGNWMQVRILAEHPIEGQFSRAVQVLNTNALLWANTFRAILTQEQRASDARETAIREIMDVADVDCRVTAARLVDAGFKREGV